MAIYTSELDTLLLLLNPTQEYQQVENKMLNAMLNKTKYIDLDNLSTALFTFAYILIASLH